jgi:hypothetical protein
MHRIKKSVSGDLTMTRPLIPLSPKEDHVELNKLRVRLATLRDACLAKLPPCEATFTQHVLRSSLQIDIWITAHIAKPPMKYTVLFGSEDRNGLSSHPNSTVYFIGGFATWAVIQIFICSADRKTC